MLHFYAVALTLVSMKLHYLKASEVAPAAYLRNNTNIATSIVGDHLKAFGKLLELEGIDLRKELPPHMQDLFYMTEDAFRAADSQPPSEPVVYKPRPLSPPTKVVKSWHMWPDPYL